MRVHTIILGDFVISSISDKLQRIISSLWNEQVRQRVAPGTSYACVFFDIGMLGLIYKYDSCVPLLLTEQTVRGNTSLRALSL